MGIILQENEGAYHVADLVSIEHKERSMIDGQIHNILSVANVITQIKTILEERHGSLKRVSVAAAGRALKTSEGSMAIDISEQSLFSTEDVNRLELAAVQQAQQKLLSSQTVTKDDYYYCVGYSVLHYQLDGEEIGSLIDQAGRSASVDVIATFLPRVVVESLLSSLKRAGLEMEALTLEPIAAINVLIPPSMRRLNVALVDIGAGTSDIAITDNNTVVAYGMVPIAGDEITEVLSNHYLLDFNLAEMAKRKISSGENVTITDILGFEQNVTPDELYKILNPSVDKLAQAISQEVQRLNSGRSPQAVMVVGGGSLTPGLTKAVSQHLELPENRVGIRGLEALSDITLEPSIVSSPELVTPIGIAIAARRAPIHYMSVTVNDKVIRLFELKEMTVGDALLAANITARQLYGKPGFGLSIKLNDKDLLIPGEHGTPSKILLNGQEVSSKSKISNGDVVELVPGQDGQNATATVQDLFEDLTTVKATIDGRQVEINPTIFINGQKKSIETSIKDRDIIQITHNKSLATALENTNRKNLLVNESLVVTINQKTKTIKTNSPQFRIGNIPVRPSYLIKDGDIITITPSEKLTVNGVVTAVGKKFHETITVTFNGELVEIRKPHQIVTLNGTPAEGHEIVKQGDNFVMTSTSESPIIFGDVFAFTDYQLPKNITRPYQLLRNGSEIGFNDEIFGGDVLEINFPE